MDFKIGWRHLGHSNRAGMFEKNCDPREKRVVPFGALGFVEDERNEKSITRAKCVKISGYPVDIDG